MEEPVKINYAYFGGGCFWCIEAAFEGLNGVLDVTSGYSGGNAENANYTDVSGGKTKHAEICKVKYDTEAIDFEILLKVFFLVHNPTTLNKQGNDIGTQYRSIIFYTNTKEKNKIKNYIQKLEQKGTYKNIKTELVVFEKFYTAEDYHQNYFNFNPNEPYCSLVINPKIQKLRKKLEQYYLK